MHPPEDFLWCFHLEIISHTGQQIDYATIPSAPPPPSCNWQRSPRECVRWDHTSHVCCAHQTTYIPRHTKNWLQEQLGTTKHSGWHGNGNSRRAPMLHHWELSVSRICRMLRALCCEQYFYTLFWLKIPTHECLYHINTSRGLRHLWRAWIFLNKPPFK